MKGFPDRDPPTLLELMFVAVAFVLLFGWLDRVRARVSREWTLYISALLLGMVGSFAFPGPWFGG